MVMAMVMLPASAVRGAASFRPSALATLSSSSPSLRGAMMQPAVGRCSRMVVYAAKKKGFGKPPPKKREVEKAPPKRQEPTLAGAAPPDAVQKYLDRTQEKQEGGNPLETDDFMAGLEAIKAKTAEETRAAPVAPSALDAPAGLDYSKPPPLSETLGMKKKDDDEDSSAGISSPVVVAFSAFGIIIFLVTSSGSDLTMALGGASSSSSSSDPNQGAVMSTETRKALQKDLQAAELALRENPEDADMLETLGGAQFALADYGKSVKTFEKLVAARPGDKGAIESLGEAQYFAGKGADAAATFKKLLDNGPETLDLLKRYADALTSAGKQQEAIRQLAAAEARAVAEGRGGGQAAALVALTSDSGSDPVDAVQVGLLIGKVYSNWEGHSADASAVYNKLIDKYPEDFRGFLARGVFYREQGKRADGDRMFIQARFLAPDPAKPLVDRVSKGS